MSDPKLKALSDFFTQGYNPGDSLQEFVDQLAKKAAEAGFDVADVGYEVLRCDALGASAAQKRGFIAPYDLEITSVKVASSAVATGTASLDLKNYDQTKNAPITGRDVLASSFDLTTLTDNNKASAPGLHATVTNRQARAGDVINAEFATGGASGITDAAVLLVFRRIDTPALP